MGQDAKAGNKYVKRISPRPGDLIALSDSLADELEKNYGLRPGKVIPPGIIPANDTNNERDIDLLAVGSLITLKNFDLFIEVVNQIKKELPGVKAILVGEGPERKYLEDMVVKLNLQNTIEVKGELSHDEVIAIMCRSKLLLHTSCYEGFPGVCNEALSAGARVISFVRPMHEGINNWIIVSNKEEMIKETLSILKSDNIDFKSFVYRSTEQTVQDIMKTFLSPV